MYTRKLALSFAKQSRLCPPPNVKNDSAHKEEVKKHFEICPFCSAGMNEDIDDMAGLAESFSKEFSHLKSVPGPAIITPGQIRAIRYDLGCWKDGYYYNPPAVMVLEVTCNISDDILVAQVYDDTCLASQNDIILQNELNEDSNLFIQTWNIYTLKAGYLGEYLGQVPDKVIEAVSKMDNSPEYFPEWAVLPMPFKKDDPRNYFQELEITVGHTFSSAASEELVHEMETQNIPLERPEVVLISGTLDKILKDISDLNKGITFPARTSNNISEIISASQFPDEYIPMAAADNDVDVIYAKLLEVKGASIANLKPLKANVKYGSGDIGITVSGFFPELPEGYKNSALNCYFIQKGNGRIISPYKEYWSSEEHSFHAEFNVKDKSSGNIEATLIMEF